MRPYGDRVWRGERTATAGESIAARGEEQPEAVAAASDVFSLDEARARLRAQATLVGGRSTLLHYDDTAESGIDITKAHPGSLPQFLTGRATLLSNLFRDEVAGRTARIAGARVTTKHVELRTARGLDSVFLAVGMASWRIGGLVCIAPVLLRPVAIRRNQADFELKLHGSFVVNPELVAALGTHFGIRLDGAALAALAIEDGVFKPQPVIDHLRALTAHIPSYTVKPRLVVSASPSRVTVCAFHGSFPRRSAPMSARRPPTCCCSTPTRSRNACSPASARGTRSRCTPCRAPAAPRPSSTPSACSCARASGCWS